MQFIFKSIAFCLGIFIFISIIICIYTVSIFTFLQAPDSFDCSMTSAWFVLLKLWHVHLLYTNEDVNIKLIATPN